MADRVFEISELQRCNGKNGMPAYVAYKGKVYDVSESFLWKNGNHQVLHDAGVDLTDSLKGAPHGPEFLDKFPIMGCLREGWKLNSALIPTIKGIIYAKGLRRKK